MILLLLYCGGILYAQPKVSGEPKAIAKMNEPLRMPVWSPDGTKLAMTSIGNDGIWIADANGKNLHQITADPGAGYQMKWSDDNVTVLARTSVKENNRIYHEVKTYNTITGDEKLILSKTRELEGLPYWNENQSVQYKVGTQLRSSNGEALDNEGNVLLRKMIENPATVASQVEGLNQLKKFIIFNPVLSPKGDKIVFQADNGNMYVCDANGSQLKMLGKGERATWTPDGKYIIASITADNGMVVTKSTLSCVDVNTGTSTVILSSDKYIAMSPAISPDGRKLAFEDYASGSIFLVDLK